MNYGMYSAFLGMRARQHTLDAIANNIANASTTGFKADHALYRSIEAAELEQLSAQAQASGAQPAAAGQAAAVPAAGAPTAANTGVPQASASQQARALGVVTSGATDYSSGPIRQTGRSLDVALNGDGFLVIQTPRGERYTRAGNLTLDTSGQLVTQRGDLVVGDSGPITVPPGEVSIGKDGTLSVNGQTAGHLKVVQFADARASLYKEGDSLFAATGATKPTDAVGTSIEQGSLEMSNVNTVSEMAAMMQNGREFESLQRSISTMNDLNRRITSDLGKI